MYVPGHFAAPDGALAELLDASSLADLVTSTPTGLVATPLPLLYDDFEQPRLIGHVARNNDHWRAGLTPGGAASLAIVRGPDAYVSPSSYATKLEHGRVVPTWNYLTAHVQGHLVAHDDPEWVEDVVRRLTERFESPRPAPWSVDDAPTAYIHGQLRAIVGVELLITAVEAKYKLSQNRSAADQAGVIETLSTGSPSERSVADAMRARQ